MFSKDYHLILKRLFTPVFNSFRCVHLALNDQFELVFHIIFFLICQFQIFLKFVTTDGFNSFWSETIAKALPFNISIHFCRRDTPYANMRRRFSKHSQHDFCVIDQEKR